MADEKPSKRGSRVLRFVVSGALISAPIAFGCGEEETVEGVNVPPESQPTINEPPRETLPTINYPPPEPPPQPTVNEPAQPPPPPTPRRPQPERAVDRPTPNAPAHPQPRVNERPDDTDPLNNL